MSNNNLPQINRNRFLQCAFIKTPFSFVITILLNGNGKMNLIIKLTQNENENIPLIVKSLHSYELNKHLIKYIFSVVFCVLKNGKWEKVFFIFLFVLFERVERKFFIIKSITLLLDIKIPASCTHEHTSSL